MIPLICPHCETSFELTWPDSLPLFRLAKETISCPRCGGDSWFSETSVARARFAALAFILSTVGGLALWAKATNTHHIVLPPLAGFAGLLSYFAALNLCSALAHRKGVKANPQLTPKDD